MKPPSSSLLNPFSSSSSSSIQLLNPSYREHVMLLCNNQDDCNSAAASAINEALKAGQLCIYASVLNGDRTHLDNMSAKISNYHQNVQDGELVIIDFYRFYDSAMASNLAPFSELKEQIETLLANRVKEGKSSKVLIFAEAAGALSERRQFDKSIDLESWWNNAHAEWIRKNLNITIICPHPSSVLSEQETLAEKNSLARVHSLTLDLEKMQNEEKNHSKKIRILMVDANEEMRLLYGKYLDKLGVDGVVAASAKEAIDHVFSATEEQGFDVIVLDSNLKDSYCCSGVAELAQKIIGAIPGQRIAFTTTSSVTDMKEHIRSAGIANDNNDYDDVIFVKPFRISSLLSLVMPPTPP